VDNGWCCFAKNNKSSEAKPHNNTGYSMPDHKDVTIGPVTLICGDSVDVLSSMPGIADLIVSDPPYKLTSGGKNSQVMSGKFANTRYDNSGKLMRITTWDDMAGPIFEAAGPDADAYIMANDKQIFRAENAFCSAGWKLHNLLSWKKESPTRNRWYMKDIEYILYLWKGKAKTINNPGSTQFMPYPRPKNAIHNTQKPLGLLTEMIENSSQPGDLVVDPFPGSGSTLVAAMRSGRRALGIELNPDMFELSKAWIAQEWQRISENASEDLSETS
jgi:site-specific DNA-methyltransferase (adenine-specific)